MSRWQAMGVLAVAATWLAGCGGPRSGLGAGAACVRSTECAAGLACIDGACTDDLSGVQGEPPAVLPPMGDGGMAMEGMDAGAMDAGGGGMDAGGGAMDAGGGGMDAGGGGMDAGAMDAGGGAMDASGGGMDAGGGAMDAGGGGAMDAGGGTDAGG